MKKKKNKALRNILAAVAVILAAVIIYAVLGQENGEPVTVAVPSTGTIVERIPANGKIHPVTEVKISPDVSGEIIELNVEEGDRVSRGDLVIKIKQDVYISLRDRAAATLNATRAQYQQQKASFTQAEQNYMRNKQLYGQKAISLQEFQASTAEYEMAREQLNAAEYNIESALVDVNENDIIRITKGDTADIEVDAYPGRTFKGVVTQIANSAKNLGSTTTALTDVTNFEVKVRILRESYADLLASDPIPFRPGMSASVEIETERKDGVTKIPLQAVTPDGCVFVLDTGH